ncbi:MAG: DUF4157 domain-containing protein [Chloroflexi bacterium]|nr:DUF4157 domain-containing protein [Chloroflexota bacterium]
MKRYRRPRPQSPEEEQARAATRRARGTAAARDGDREEAARDPQRFLAIQRTLGNREAGRLLEEPEPSVQQPATPPPGPSGDVRVHAGPDAAAMAARLGARAFTSGREIWLGPGESPTDARLMAHELAHVAQQADGRVAGQPGHVRPAGDALEREAEGVAAQGTGAPASLVAVASGAATAPQGAVQRQEQPGGEESAASSDIASQMPAQTQLTSASLSLTIPGNRQLTNNWNDLSTTDPTTVRLTITPAGIQLRFSPALLIDVQWPVSDIAWSGVDYDFASGAISSIHLRSTQDVAISGAHGAARGEIGSFVSRLLAGTPIATPGYNPLADPDLAGTLQAIRANWDREPSGADIERADVRNVEVSAEVAFEREVSAGTPASPAGGIVIPSGGRATVTVTLEGSAADLATASAPRVRFVTIDSEEIFLRQEGRDLAKLQTIDIEQGGQVRVRRFEALGSLRTAEGVETVGNFVGLLLLLGRASPSDRLALAGREPHLEPTIVPGIARDRIETSLTEAVRRFIIENPRAIPGIDLGEVFGVQNLGDFPLVPPAGPGTARP